MIRTSRDTMRAWIVLASGAAFPRPLMDRLVAEAGIVHGINDGGLAEAAALAADMPRKLILAEGDSAAARCAWGHRLGAEVKALTCNVVIDVAEDGLSSAVALTPPDEPVPERELFDELNAAGVIYGRDERAIDQRCHGGSE